MSTCVLLTTIDPDRADAFARSLVEDRVVACVNVLPGARSVYRWKGSIESEAEAVLLMETWAGDDAAVAEAIQRVAAKHPYEVPKVLALEPRGSLASYAEWVAQQTQSQ